MDSSKKWKFLKGSIIVVEGNIASGKSTLTHDLTEILTKAGYNTALFMEPILQDYLDAFITNQNKYAFGFQMSMLIENQCLYAAAIEFANKGGIAIMDRSFLGNRVFAEVQRENGNITEKEFSIYDGVYQRMSEFPKPDYIIYLNVDPRVNVQRCSKRDRSCESDNYDLEYFKSLNRNYLKVMDELDTMQNIIRLDWSRDLNTLDEQREASRNVLEAIRVNYLADM